MFFKNILVPVDFSINTEVAICKALDIIVEQEVTIHLLHICKSSVGDVSFGKTGITEKEIEAEIKLKEWKMSIEEYLPFATVFYCIIYASSVQQAIAEKVCELKSDLIVIGKKSNHYFLPLLNTVVSSALAKQTGCSVLTVKPGSLQNRIEKVVVPVNDDDIEQKMKAISVLCRKHRPKIFIVSFADQDSNADKFSSSPLLKVYRWIKTNLHCNVEHVVLLEPNRAKAVLKFAAKFEADILLLKPEETKTGWMGQHIFDLLPSESKVQVLTV